MLVANSENVKVVQELMCDARSTLEVYSQAKNHGKAGGAATHCSDDSLWEASGCEIALLHTGPRERLDSIT